MLPKPDSELIQRYVKNGDEEAFNELYSRYKPKVRAWVRKRLPKNDLTEDLPHALFVGLA